MGMSKQAFTENSERTVKSEKTVELWTTIVVTLNNELEFSFRVSPQRIFLRNPVLYRGNGVWRYRDFHANSRSHLR